MSVLKFGSFLQSNLSSSLRGAIFSRTKFTKPPEIPKHHEKPEITELPSKNPVIPKQKFDYFLALNIETTSRSFEEEPKEIIEFPVVKVNAETLLPEATFHSFVRPTVVPQISDSIISSKGITQEMIDQQPNFKVVFQNFLEWLEKGGVLKPGVKFAMAISSDRDLNYFFPLQCNISGIEVPDFMKRWINVNKSYAEFPPYKLPVNLRHMMRFCDLPHEEDPQSGMGDAMNIASVLKHFAKRGLVLDFNGSEE